MILLSAMLLTRERVEKPAWSNYAVYPPIRVVFLPPSHPLLGLIYITLAEI